MAYTSSIDELNNLQTEQDKQKIRKYFEEMDLEPEEIEKRINTANGINNLYLILFLLMSASATAGESVIDDNEYWNDFLTRGYNDVLSENGYDTDDPMIGNRIDETVAEVLNTTYEHIAQAYYLSHDRALMIASNDTNAFANYEQHIQAIKSGYTRKRWVSMRDKKVRHTHVWADGQETDIQKPFIVGGYEMLFPLDQSLGADAKEAVGCRCVCRYFDKNKANDYERGIEKARSAEEIGQSIDTWNKRLDDILGSQTTYKGYEVINDDRVSRSDPNGIVYINKHSREITDMHELLHQRSYTIYAPNDYAKYARIEEGSVELLAEQIGKQYGIKTLKHDDVEALLTINKSAKINPSDYDFALELFKQPLQERTGWLIRKINEAQISSAEKSRLQDIMLDFIEDFV